jgi:hypothetical protein
MTLWNVVGYLPSGLVLTAFCLTLMLPLRVAALCSNVAFVAYGLGRGLAPVWLLHSLLLPIAVDVCGHWRAAAAGNSLNRRSDASFPETR